jgi:hypothetical protein
MAGVPNTRQLNKYNVNRPGVEAVDQPLYDYQTYPLAGSTQLQFFQIPKGQSGKTFADTNMTSAGQLSQPQSFLIHTISVEFFSGIDVSPAEDVAAPFAVSKGINDVMSVMKSGWLELFIGSKPYLDLGPLMRFPMESGLGGFAAMSSATTAAATSSYNTTQYARSVGKVFRLRAPLRLEANQNFNVSLNFPTAVALPSGVDGRIGVNLGGILYRKSQ